LPSFDATFVDALELRAIVLDECTVTRGKANHDTPGELKSSFAIEPSYDGEGRLLTYIVRADHEFINTDEELVVEINVSMAVLYDVQGDVEPSEEAIEEFGSTSALTQATPFLREFLASMTNRLGMPVFYLPLLRIKRARGRKRDVKQDKSSGAGIE
jgi:hypothetical protein